MRRLFLIAITTTALGALSGCALFDAYFMAKYDTTEYALVNEIKTKAQVAEENCSNQPLVTSQVNDLYIKSLEFKNFTLHIPRNKDANNMSTKLLTLTKDTKEYFNKAEKISPIFCKAKLQQVVKSADTIQNALGKKPK
jgi:hypothetical protein